MQNRREFVQVCARQRTQAPSVRATKRAEFIATGWLPFAATNQFVPSLRPIICRRGRFSVSIFFYPRSMEHVSLASTSHRPLYTNSTDYWRGPRSYILARTWPTHGSRMDVHVGAKSNRLSTQISQETQAASDISALYLATKWKINETGYPSVGTCGRKVCSAQIFYGNHIVGPVVSPWNVARPRSCQLINDRGQGICIKTLRPGRNDTSDANKCCRSRSYTKESRHSLAG